MNASEFKKRTTDYALRIIRITETLPNERTSWVLGRQLLRSGTSVGANYRAACRAKSRADFVSKMRTVEEECDGTLYWLELLVETGKLNQVFISDVLKEGNEILALTVASVNTARSGSQLPGPALRAKQSASNNRQFAME
jgi:four helix bundle protein